MPALESYVEPALTPLPFLAFGKHDARRLFSPQVAPEFRFTRHNAKRRFSLCVLLIAIFAANRLSLQILANLMTPIIRSPTE